MPSGFMNIDILSHDEHTRQRKAELALAQNRHRDASEHWSMTRKALLDKLGARWKIDPTEYGDGDFFVGEDWSGNRALHLVAIRWEVLTIEFIEECHEFLVPPHDDFLITVGKSMPEVEDMFELVITKQRAYISFFRKGADETRIALTTQHRYHGIKSLLA